MTVFTKILTLTAIAFASISLYSCMNDSSSSNVERDNNCAITRMTMGTLTRQVHSKTSAGDDTTYNINIAGSVYALYIDQLSQEIYNQDSLPVNTDVQRIIFSSISSDGTVYYQNDNGKDTLYAKSDTIDFTNPRYFTCYSTDGSQSRKYRVTINVHNSQPENFTWKAVAADAQAFSGVSAQKMFVCDSVITIVAVKDGTPAVLKASTKKPTAWNTTSITGLTALNPANVIMHGATLCYADNGVLKTSADGATWQAQTTNISLDKLFATSPDKLYALSNGKIYCSSDLKQWSEDAVADDLAQFPVENITSAYNDMTFNNNFYYIIACGNNSEGNKIVWKKIVDKQGANTEPWTIFPQAEDGKNAYPSKEQALVVSYDAKLYHFGLNAEGNPSEIMISTDGGRCWLPQTSTNNPTLASGATSFSAFCDADNYLWIATAPDGKVVKGRINRLSYDKKPTVFPKTIIK